MSTSPAAGQRLISLDAFRGITIAGMILVNNPGSWSHIYAPLRHAPWHGWTPTDLVFPFFLFIVGVAMTLSLRKRLALGADRFVLLGQILRRSLILFLLGLIMYGFPDWRLIWPYVAGVIGLTALYWHEPAWRFGTDARRGVVKTLALALLLAAIAGFVLDLAYFDESRLRVPGVLQRIAVCYFAAGLILLSGRTAWRAGWAAVLLLGYWAIVSWVQPPADYAASVTGPEGLLHDWIDVRVLGEHLYRERPDPEGLLSTLPAIATVLLGVLTGSWIVARRGPCETVAGLFVAANLALLVGLVWGEVFPINKKIWTSSYVVLTAGLALHFLAMCYWLIDIRGWRRWAWPFVVFGSNAITVFVASSLLAKMLGRWQVTTDSGVMSVKSWLFENLFASWAAPKTASLLYAVTYIGLWLIPMIVMHRRRWFVKV